MLVCHVPHIAMTGVCSEHRHVDGGPSHGQHAQTVDSTQTNGIEWDWKRYFHGWVVFMG